MDELARVLIVGLAGWRLAHLIIDEDGPLASLARFRGWLGLYDSGEQSGLQQLFTCVYCLSVWTSAAFWLLWGISVWIPGIMAASTVALIAHAVVEGDRH